MTYMQARAEARLHALLGRTDVSRLEQALVTIEAQGWTELRGFPRVIGEVRARVRRASAPV